MHRALGNSRVDDRAGVEFVLARAMEKHPGVTPRIISYYGPQFQYLLQQGKLSTSKGLLELALGGEDKSPIGRTCLYIVCVQTSQNSGFRMELGLA